MQNSDGKEIAISESKIRTVVSGIVATILLVASFVFAYGETFTKILQTNAISDRFHSLIIAGISVYIVWRKREVISTLTIQPNFWGGSFVTLLGCMMLVAGKLSHTPLLKEISFVPTLLGVVWLCLGGGFLRELWFPIACLIFMFPVVGGILSDVWSIYLQYVAAWIAAKALGLAGMTVLLEGQYITLPHIKLEVARVCNGANHIITLIALSVLLAWADQKSRLKKGLLILSGGLIGILANGLRVGAIGFWSSYSPNGRLHGPGDVLYVSVIFIFALMLLFGVNLVLRKWRPQLPPLDRFGNGKSIPFFSRFFLTTPFILATGLVFVASLYAHLWTSSPVPLTKPLAEFPRNVGEWIGEDRPIKDGVLSLATPDAVLRRAYRNRSGQEAQLEIAYFAEQNESKKITSYLIKWPPEGTKEIQVPLNLRIIQLNRSEIQNGTGDKIIYSWYDINGRILSGRYAAKIASLYDAFFQKHTNGAIIAVSAMKSGGGEGADVELSLRQFFESSFPLIEKWLRPSPADLKL